MAQAQVINSSKSSWQKLLLRAWFGQQAGMFGCPALAAAQYQIYVQDGDKAFISTGGACTIGILMLISNNP